MHDARTVAFALGSALPSGAGWLARCPVPTHGRGRGDVHPSLSVLDGEAGRLLVRCHAGCGQERVIAVLRSRGLWPERHWSRSRTPVAPTKSLTNDHHCRSTATAPERDSGSSTGISRIWAESHRYPERRSSATSALAIWMVRSRPPYAAIRGCHTARAAAAGRRWLRQCRERTGGSPAFLAPGCAPIGAGKAPVEPQRMMLGRCAGGAVRLALAGHDLQVGEGLETCLRGRRDLPGRRRRHDDARQARCRRRRRTWRKSAWHRPRPGRPNSSPTRAITPVRC